MVFNQLEYLLCPHLILNQIVINQLFLSAVSPSLPYSEGADLEPRRSQTGNEVTDVKHDFSLWSLIGNAVLKSRCKTLKAWLVVASEELP